VPTTLKNFPVPPHDTQRLEALRECQILDTLPEEAYDDITLLASQLCDAPISLVSLVDGERQWFKARHGLDANETPRHLAFCTHAIMRPTELLVVDDATQDPRFASNELVTGEPTIRFYAGAPLVTSKGHALGTLCVMDRVPRHLSAPQLGALRALSRQVVAHLELRRTIAELELKDKLMEEFRLELKQYQAQLKEATVQLHEQSFTDALTSVFNRRGLMLHLERAIQNAGVRHDKFTLIMLDVDHFKHFNDDYGHLAGDEVLRQVAQSMRAGLRKVDIVARFGGEEFAVILPGVGLGEGCAVAEKLCERVRQAPRKDRRVTISAGVASLNEDARTAEQWIAAADKALYEAKDRGRDQVAWYQVD
jgi:diguanylate cyclase (GGDEF)-like protein